MKIKTQKAKGVSISAISDLNAGAILNIWRGRIVNDIKKISGPFPAFARPCPTKPRHGFVESKIVNSKSQATSLFKEAIKADSNAEMLLGPPIDAVVSAIVTGDGLLSLGKGHDGATSGKDSFSIRVAPLAISKATLEAARISDNPYVEIVCGNELTRNKFSSSTKFNLNKLEPPPSTWVVQMRDGPKGTFTSDFIPKKTEVKKVISPCEDLLEWEEICRNLPEGVVVYSPGSTLASHAAVHCVINNIPFITSYNPTVGSFVEPNEQSKQKDFDKNTFEQYLAVGQKIIKSDNNFLTFCFAVIHNWAYLKNSSYAERYLGAALGGLAWAGLAACHGEYRHIKINGGKYVDRRSIYKNIDLSSIETIKKTTKIDFFYKLKSASFGGQLWNDSFIIALSLIHNLRDGKIKDAIQEANKLINASHNGGHLLNKFVDNSVFDIAASNPGLIAASQAYWFYQLGANDLTIKPLKLSKWTNWLPKKKLQLDTDNLCWKNIESIPNMPSEFGYFVSIIGNIGQLPADLNKDARSQILFEKTNKNTWRFDYKSTTWEIV